MDKIFGVYAIVPKEALGRLNRPTTELEAAVENIHAKAQWRLTHGHNDTCAQSLSADYICSCGHTDLEAALAKLDALLKPAREAKEGE